MAEPAPQIVFGRSATEDGPPTVEVVVGAPVSCLQLGRLQASWFEDHVAGVVSVPIPVQQPILGLHPGVEGRVRVGRQDVEGRGFDPLLDRPLDRPLEDVRAVVVHAEDKAAVDHHTEVVQPPDGRRVVAADVLVFPLLLQVVAVDGLEADEEAAQAARDRLLEDLRLLEDGLDRARRLPHPVHPAHPVEKRLGKGRAAEQVVVEEVEVAARQPVDLGQRPVDGLHVELLAALEEGDLVAEVAHVRASPGDDDRVGHQVQAALDQVSTDRRYGDQRPLLRDVPGPRPAAAEVVEEPWPGVLSRPEKDAVRVLRRLLGKRGHVQPAERDVAAPGAVEVGDLVGPPSRGYVDLDDDQVRLIVQGQPLDMLVGDGHLIALIEVGGEGREPEGREERVLDRPEEGAGGLGQGRQDHPHPQSPLGHIHRNVCRPPGVPFSAPPEPARNYPFWESRLNRRGRR